MKIVSQTYTIGQTVKTSLNFPSLSSLGVVPAGVSDHGSPQVSAPGICNHLRC
uniref:Uncharacterized protein n=1 Tax=Arion vulgaris TaxID=1028688 RepID=A0A0B7ADK7_9EUPU